MQCASCQAVYSNALEACPRCQPHAVSTRRETTDGHGEAPSPVEAKSSANGNGANGNGANGNGASPQARPTTTAATAQTVSTAQTASTLIEFPGTMRPQQPAWRKQLSERVREIQERRAREAQEEAATHTPARPAAAHALAASQQLGLVPLPADDEPRLSNPIVAAALRRVERARQIAPLPPVVAAPLAAAPALPAENTIDQTQQTIAAETSVVAVATNELDGLSARTASSAKAVLERPSTATNFDINSPAYIKHKQEEEARNRAKQLAANCVVASSSRAGAAAATNTIAAAAPRHRAATAQSTTEAQEARRATQPSQEAATRQTKLAAVPVTPTSLATTDTVTDAASATHALLLPRRVTAEVLDEGLLARREAEQARREAAERRTSPDDYAPLASRIAGGVIDLIVMLFIASPIAATLEYTYADWSNITVRLAMGLSFVAIIFLYIALSTLFAGRTWGMSLLSLRAVDVETGMIPTAGQSARRAAAYIVSLAFIGLGFLYALIDPERRGAHDHLSGTVVVRE